MIAAKEKETTAKKSSVRHLSVLRTPQKIQETQSGRVISVFFNIDMRLAHPGLANIASMRDIDVKNLLPGNYVVFINSARDRLKFYAAGNVIAYYRSTKGKINLETIQHLPKYFNGSSINMDKATSGAFREVFLQKTK